MSEFMKGLGNLLTTMSELIGDDYGIDMDETCGTEGLHKARKVRYGQDRTKDTSECG